MYYVYILKSIKDNTHYIGFTNNLINRLKLHNKKKVLSTKLKTPYKIVYYEAYASRDEAKLREHNLKLRAQALNALKRRIKKSLEA
ncbi:MAG: GIY-YIG nuclease family protein [Candidatus Paceibacterota bacterium]|jgi:putative endonuclease|nr:GIY-YIG nuclease family protein [Candidatus Paceibacterota bacterium]